MDQFDSKWRRASVIQLLGGDDFSNVNWNEVLALEKGNVDDFCNSFLDKLTLILDNNVPLVQ